MEYYRRVKEFNPDTVFILDQPVVSQDFLHELEKDGINVVWIDHHEIDLKEILPFVNYFNPIYSGDLKNIPVTAICYEVSLKKEDLWLAVIGTISDKFLMPFYDDFLEKYPDLGINSKEPFDIFYNSQIGKISRMLGIGLKDRTTNVVRMMRFLVSVKTPYEILEEKKENMDLHKRFIEIDAKFKRYIDKAKKESGEGKVLFFRYSGDTSMSADIANKLSYLFPEKYIIVAFVKEGKVNLSLRGKGIRDVCLGIINKIPFATCGGHEDAIGAQMDFKELNSFVDKVSERLISN